MAQVFGDEDSKKLQPLSVPKIVEQLERALMDIKYSQSGADDEMFFNKMDNVPIKSERRLPNQFIGKELMLFEMVGILNGKITELEKKYEKLKCIEEKEEQFISSKADEITNPVQDIVDYAKLVKSGKIDQDEAWQGVLKVAKKLQNVTTVVLDTNRVDNDSLQLTQKNEKINDIISDVVNACKSTDTKVPIHIGLDYNIEIPVDKVRLAQVLQTILHNAVESTQEGHIKIESFVAHEQNVVIIRISDTGKGIPEEILPKIFEKDSDESLSETKLNLYLCQGIINAHGGKITAKNNKDAGATYTVTLPIKNN